MNRTTHHMFLAGCLALLSVAMLGCDGGAEAEGTDRPVIGVSIPAATHGWTAGVGWWAQQTIEAYPEIAWRFQRAEDAQAQVRHIENMIAQGIDALVVLPEDSDTALPAIERAKQAGAYIVSVDRGLRRPVADVYLAGDNRAFGRISAEFMVEKLGGAGRIVILRGKAVEIDTERYEAAREVFDAYEGIEILGVQRGEWNQQDAHRVMQDFLTQHDDIDAVWASDDDMARGVEQALRERGRTDEMWILGGAGMKQIVERVMNNDPLYPANVTYPPGMIAAGIHLAVAEVMHDGDELAVADAIPAHLAVNRDQLVGSRDERGEGQRTVRIGIELVTAENAADFYFPDSVY